jgi:hypothetical protein
MPRSTKTHRNLCIWMPIEFAERLKEQYRKEHPERDLSFNKWMIAKLEQGLGKE